MINPEYKERVRLLLRIIPIVSDEECFAIHGGTAINLFIQNLPRYSVDSARNLISRDASGRNLVLAQAGQHAPFPGRDAFAELRKVGPTGPVGRLGLGGGCQAGAEQSQHQGRRCGGEMEWAHGHHGWRGVERLMVWPLGRVTTASVASGVRATVRVALWPLGPVTELSTWPSPRTV